MNGRGCESFIDDLTGILCGEPAIGQTVTACIHEHVGRRAICAGCACELQRWAAADELICTHCDEGDNAHNCRVASYIEWFCGTPATVLQAGVS